MDNRWLVPCDLGGILIIISSTTGDVSLYRMVFDLASDYLNDRLSQVFSIILIVLSVIASGWFHGSYRNWCDCLGVSTDRRAYCQPRRRYGYHRAHNLDRHRHSLRESYRTNITVRFSFHRCITHHLFKTKALIGINQENSGEIT